MLVSSAITFAWGTCSSLAVSAACRGCTHVLCTCMCLLCGCLSVQLQSHYDLLAEKLGAEISQTLCEGAASNPLIMEGLSILESNCFSSDDASKVRISFFLQYGIYVCTYYNDDRDMQSTSDWNKYT